MSKKKIFELEIGEEVFISAEVIAKRGNYVLVAIKDRICGMDIVNMYVHENGITKKGES